MNFVLTKFLDKIIQLNKVVDSRGVMQVNRMIAVELEDIYISLNFELGNGPIPITKKVFSDYTSWSDYLLHLESPLGTDTKFLSQIRQIAPMSSFWTSATELKSNEPHHHINYDELLKYFPTKEIISLETLWDREDRWVVLGDPGAGKSTLLKYLALHHAKKSLCGEECIPLPVTLRNFGHEWKIHGWSFKEAILSYICGPFLEELGFLQNERHILWDIFHDALERGKALLLLDGLDEQRDVSAKKETNRAIDLLLNRFPNNRCMVTSRIVGYDISPLDGEFCTAVLQPFDNEQIVQFFDKWFYAIERSEDIVDDEATKIRAEKKARELIIQVNSNDAVGGLAANPLLCTIIGLIYRQGGSTLPTLRAELYKLCIDTFIFNWEMNKIRKGIDHVSLDKDETQAALEAIALYLHENCPQNAATRDELVDVVTDFLKDDLGYNGYQAKPRAEQLLDLARDVAGLLIERGHNTFGFFHLTFQEYLTARAITRKRRLIDKYLGSYLYSPRWREVIHLAAAHQGMKDEETGSDFVNAILRHPHQREKEMQYAFRIAFQCAAEARVELETSDQLLSRWINLYLERPELVDLMPEIDPKLRYRNSTLISLFQAFSALDEDKRGRAVDASGIIKSIDAVDYLVKALKDVCGDVRMRAARSLGEIRSLKAVQPLLEALTDESESVQAEAARALGVLKAEEAVKPLLLALKDEKRRLSWEAARALGAIKSPGSVQSLTSLILNAAEPVTVSRAITALKEIETDNAIASLVSLLQQENLSVRGRVAGALREVNSSKVAWYLMELLHHNDPDVSNTAAGILISLKVTDAEELLAEKLRDPNPSVRRWAVGSLGVRKCYKRTFQVLTVLYDEDANVQGEAVDTLGELEASDAVQPLIKVLTEGDETLRLKAARALGKIKHISALDALIQALKDEDPYVRGEAAEALGEINSAAALEPLVEALDDNVETVRIAAAAALGEMKAKKAVGALIKALKDINQDVRWQAVNSLGIIMDSKALKPLTEALGDENFEIRWEASVAIAAILKSSELVMPLIEALKADNTNLRIGAAGVLGETKTKEAVPALIGALKDASEEVRIEAAMALGEISAKEAIVSLIDVMLNQNEKAIVRVAAAEAVERIDMGGVL